MIRANVRMLLRDLLGAFRKSCIDYSFVSRGLTITDGGLIKCMILIFIGTNEKGRHFSSVSCKFLAISLKTFLPPKRRVIN